jgi:hypothetical protein
MMNGHRAILAGLALAGLCACAGSAKVAKADAPTLCNRMDPNAEARRRCYDERIEDPSERERHEVIEDVLRNSGGSMTAARASHPSQDGAPHLAPMSR